MTKRPKTISFKTPGLSVSAQFNLDELGPNSACPRRRGGTAFAKAKPSGDAAIVAAHSQAQKNKALVLKAYQELLGDHDVTALDRYWSEGYIQHNPH